MVRNRLLLTVGSGDYTFTYKNDDLFRVAYTEESLVRELLAYEEDKELLVKHLPEVDRPPLKFYVKINSYT
ncbi:hypothetical protein ACVNS2_05655 [Paenibacillus caseinilyticus]|uniref:Uncharacterized protein n=1 Tax=Paenibacillus mucilaginosus K02 TaxID=997761 RepID=I0BCR6_9BACL|nr:hypothetical protein [Paenibacillus mucilaginosus]AFH60163.1 hypothetical protein B2K_05400 [Paenibacillus mucilaginosus K02]